MAKIFSVTANAAGLSHHGPVAPTAIQRHSKPGLWQVLTCMDQVNSPQQGVDTVGPRTGRWLHHLSESPGHRLAGHSLDIADDGLLIADPGVEQPRGSKRGLDSSQLAT